MNYVNNIPFISNIPKIRVSKLPPDIKALFERTVKEGYRQPRRPPYPSIPVPAHNLGLLSTLEADKLVVLCESGAPLVLDGKNNYIRVSDAGPGYTSNWKYQGDAKIYQIVLEPLDRIKSFFKFK